MRTLVFIPGNYGHNSRQFFKDEITARLNVAAAHDLGDIKPIDAEADYEASSWEDLLATLKLYKSEFDCVVIAVDAKKVSEGNGVIKNRMEAINEITSGIPIVAYVDELGPQTAYQLLSSDFSFIVDRSHDERTLAASVGRAVALRSASGRMLKVGPLSIDMTTGEAYINEGRIHLTKKENDLLLLLARRKGSLVSRDQMMDALYSASPDDAPERKIIDVFICKIRKKLNDLAVDHPILGSVIETVWGRGYRLMNYAPEDLRFSIGPLVLRYDTDQKHYVTLDDRFTFNDTEVVILGFLANAENKAVTLEKLQENLANADHGFMPVPAIRQILESLRPRLKIGANDSEPMLRSQADESWTLFNPFLGREATARRQADILHKGTEEVVDGITFRHIDNSSYTFVGENPIRVTANQFRFFKFLSGHKGQGFNAKDLYRTLLNPPPSMLLSYASHVRKVVDALNRTMKPVPGYVPIHLKNNDQVIGMAAKAANLIPPAAAGVVPVTNGNGAAGGFKPVARGIGKDGRPILGDSELFDVTQPYTVVKTGWFDVQVNNKTRSAFAPKEMVPFTPQETLFLLRLWYADGGIVPSADLGNKPTAVSLVASGIEQKLTAKNPEWKGVIYEVPGGGFAFRRKEDAPGGDAAAIRTAATGIDVSVRGQGVTAG